jgi:hypothetical protein
MRTPGGEVIRGRWGWSLSGGRLSESFSADGVAVLMCRTASCLAGDAMRHELPIFRIKDRGPTRAILVFLPADDWLALADGRKYTKKYD